MRRFWVSLAFGAVLAAGMPASSALPATPPTPVQNLRVSAPSDGTATVLWDPPLWDGGAPISHYEVWRITQDGWTYLDSTTSTSFVDGGFAVPDTGLLGYRVGAFNSAGLSSDSAWVGFVRAGGDATGGCTLLDLTEFPNGFVQNVPCFVIWLAGTMPDEVGPTVACVFFIIWNGVGNEGTAGAAGDKLRGGVNNDSTCVNGGT